MEPRPAGIRLTLLGPPVLAVDGVPPGVLLGAKPLALLAYLALEDGPHPRELLAALLWGDNPDPAARASLRQAVKQLRDLLGENLRVSRDSVELDRGVD